MQHIPFLPGHVAATAASDPLPPRPPPGTPLNPFLASLFFPPPGTARSRDFQAALRAPQMYVIFVPVTSSILYTVDRESGQRFTELCAGEDFLASHILRVDRSSKVIAGGRARIFWTLNGRSVILNDDFVSTQHGFKSRQARVRILGDQVYTPSTNTLPYDTQFSIYHIARPLIGVASPLCDFAPPSPEESGKTAAGVDGGHMVVVSFQDMLNKFPAIERPVREPLATAFELFNCNDATEPDLVAKIEEVMEKGIKSFQSAESFAINAMANATGLTGPDIEKMLEDYVSEHLHAKIWARLVILRSLKDSIIRAAARNMRNISLEQLGVKPFWTEGGDAIERMVMNAVTNINDIPKGKNAAAQVKGLVEILRSLGVVPPTDQDAHDGSSKDDSSGSSTEKKEKSPPNGASNVSADLLVSLMILVVTWSKLDHLDAMLFYMRNFSFMDVDTGEVGYALSTFEAVIFHIMNNSQKLAVVSSANEVFRASLRKGEDVTLAFSNPAEYFGSQGIDVSEIDSFEHVYRCRTAAGESAIMLAIQAVPCNVSNVMLLLSKRDVFPIEAITRDQNSRQTTLFSAAVQTGNKETVDAIWSVLSANCSDAEIRRYLARKDEWQRNVGHYLFSIPQLIEQIGGLISWTDKDSNGQTPLFALCRSYDHPQYRELVKMGVDTASSNQPGGGSLRFLDHIDLKGNTLLHIMTDIPSLKLLIDICDIDLNRANKKGLTPLMVNSKFSRSEAITVLTNRPDVDISRRNYRGLNAAELAKEEKIRSYIDDITLFRREPLADGRVTSVLRGFFFEDNLHFVIKTGLPPAFASISAVKRTISDFKFIADLLAFEQPCSWMPQLNISLNPFATSFVISTRSARALVRDIQFKLDSFIHTLLLHPTFSTHELLWEFFLVTEMSRELSQKRSKQKVDSRKDTLEDDYPPVENTDEVAIFFDHALHEMGNLDAAFLQTVKSYATMQQKTFDLAEAHLAAQEIFHTMFDPPDAYTDAISEFISVLQIYDSHEEQFGLELRSAYATMQAVITALSQPKSLVDQLTAQTAQLTRLRNTLNRASTRLPLGLLDDSRSRYAHDASLNIQTSENEIARLGSEIRYAQTVLASELGGFNELHEKEGVRVIKEYVREKIKWEKVRLRGMQSALNKIKFK
ncbi:uncharacterized protein V1518DRAFT_426401 [Limtongia smithiae]|uniref:uncharacterized protein n=1 Tax=Limtongia smithiae TaxID=1125753 RepID=UPI0034CE47E3